jgi:hypothetical protein
VDLDDDAFADINTITGALKLWFRELPDPLFTYSLYPQFMEAAREFTFSPSLCLSYDSNRLTSWSAPFPLMTGC